MPERKAVKLTIPDDAPPGSFLAVFSTFDVVDKGGDIVRRAAFADLDGVEVPLIWAHDWSDLAIGRGHIRVQPKQAVFEGAFHLQSERSREAYATVKAMVGLQEFSYGFDIAPDGAEAAPENSGAFRVITKISRVYEVSPVLVGMGEDTRVLAIKDAASALIEAKAGRRLSAESQSRIQAAVDALTALMDEAPDAPTDDAPPDTYNSPPLADEGTGADADAVPATLAGALQVAEQAVRGVLALADRSSHADVLACADATTALVYRLADARTLLAARLRHAKAGDVPDPAQLYREFAALDRGLAPILGGGH